MRLYLREAIDAIIAGIKQLQNALLEQQISAIKLWNFSIGQLLAALLVLNDQNNDINRWYFYALGRPAEGDSAMYPAFLT